MATQVQTKSFEADTIAALETALNTYLATLNAKDVLDVMRHSFASSKYGQHKTHTATVVHLVTV